MTVNSRLVDPFQMISLILVVLSACVPGKAHAPGVLLSGLGAATINGTIGLGEWNNAGCINFNVNTPKDVVTPGTICAMNDATNLYLLVTFERDHVDALGTGVVFEFDNDHDGVREVGDDAIGANTAIGFHDNFRDFPFGPFDTASGGTQDGASAFANDGALSVFELAHPLNSADDAHDFSLVPADVVGFTLSLRMIAAPGVFPVDFGDTDFPTPCVECADLFGDIVIASLPVAIDVFPRNISSGSFGTIPVALLSSATFNALTDADRSSLTFGRTGDEQSLAFCNSGPAHVNGDGYPDLICHFYTQQAAFQAGDTTGVLKGKTLTNIPFMGTDLLQIRP